MSVPASWSFLDTVCRAMLEFKCYQYFPDPDGFWDGPSGYAGRTGGSYVFDQRDRLWREVFAGATFQEGYPLARSVRWQTIYVPAISTVVSDINSAVTWFNNGGIGTAITTTAPAWVENHWQSESVYFPADGWYADIRARLEAWGDAVKFPFEISQSFNKSFNDEFWAYRSNTASRDFGFFIECLTDAGNYSGWYSGSIQAFWTPETGKIILAKHDKSGSDAGDQENTRVWSDIDRWATQHVWGRDELGNAFTPVCVELDNHTVTAALTNNPPSVTVVTVIDPAVTVLHGQQTGSEITGTVTFTHQFTALANGVRTNYTITSDQADQITELWATIPVYLRDAEFQPSRADTTIEYWSGATWASLSTTLTNARYLRLGRDFGSGSAYVYVVLDQARPQKLSAAAWQQSYQGDTRIRNVHIDLHGDPGTALTFPATTELEYDFVVDDPTV